MSQTDQDDARGTVEETSGCTCVVCVTSRANRRQSELIKQLTAEIERLHAAVAEMEKRVAVLTEEKRQLVVACEAIGQGARSGYIPRAWEGDH